jgi:hypothetical protein
MKIFLVAALAAVLAIAAQQPEQIDLTKLGPQVGEKAIAFTLPDHTGTSRELATLAGPNGTMLVFFRSSDW